MADKVLVLENGSGLIERVREAVATTSLDLEILIGWEGCSSLDFVIFEISEDRVVDRFIDISFMFPTVHPIVFGTPRSDELVMKRLAQVDASFLPTLDDPLLIALTFQRAFVKEESSTEWN